MRIGFFVDSYLPNTFGVTVSIESFRKNLEKLGNEVFIFAPRFSGYKDTNPRVFRFRSLKILNEPEMRISLPVFSDDTKQFKKVETLKLDIIHSHSPFTMGGFGKYIAQKQNIPFVYTHHTQYADYAKVYLKEKVVLPRLAKMWTRVFSNWADLVIAPSPKIKRILRELGIRKKIVILPTGINLNLFKKSSEGRKKMREELGVAPQTKILLYVGRVSEEKNVAFLIDALGEILKLRKDVRLFIVGMQKKPYLKKIKKKSEENGVRSFVRFVQQVPRKKIPFFYQAADIFTFPSLTETQGIVVLEAAASGLPIVALDDDAFGGIIIDNKNGFLVKKKSSFSFARRVLEILEKKELQQRFSSESQAIAKTLSEEKQTKKLLNLYASLK
ncbi:glycosyltransferase [bacterium]|nr:glycosyltransferase [bacterium]